MDESTAVKVILEMGEEIEDSNWFCNYATGEIHAPNLILGLQQSFGKMAFHASRLSPWVETKSS